MTNPNKIEKINNKKQKLIKQKANILLKIKAKYQFFEETNKIDKPYVRLLTKRNPLKLLNISGMKVYNTTKLTGIKNIKIRCKQGSSNKFENLNENNISLKKQFTTIGTRCIENLGSLIIIEGI